MITPNEMLALILSSPELHDAHVKAWKGLCDDDGCESYGSWYRTDDHSGARFG